MSEDPLESLLEIAEREGTLAADSLAAFAMALRDRARLIVEERVHPLEERAAAFEKEAGWLRGLVEAREGELVALRARLEAAFQEHAEATRAHDRLLVHHKDVLGQVVGALETAARALPWWRGEARQKLADLSEALRKELG